MESLEAKPQEIPNKTGLLTGPFPQPKIVLQVKEQPDPAAIAKQRVMADNPILNIIMIIVIINDK